MPSPCLLVFVVAYHSLPNFLFGFELRLSHFITGLKDWNKDCPLFFLFTGTTFSIWCTYAVFSLLNCLPFRHLFLRLCPIVTRVNVFFLDNIILGRGVYSIIADIITFLGDLGLTAADCITWCETHLFLLFREWWRSLVKLGDVTLHNEKAQCHSVLSEAWPSHSLRERKKCVAVGKFGCFSGEECSFFHWMSILGINYHKGGDNILLHQNQCHWVVLMQK